MSGGTHLELEERERLAALKAEGLSLRSIARALGRAASTVSRELRCNALPRGGYLQVHAEGCYRERRQRRAILERDVKLGRFVRERLLEGWTPEQIAGWLRRGEERGLRVVSPETIYAFVHRPGQKAEKLWKLLPRGSARRGRRRARQPRNVIAERRSIHDRPESVEHRREAGHWEGDLLICKRTRPVLVLKERKTRFVLAARLAGKSAAETVAVVMAVLRRLDPRLRSSITFDNDTAFARHGLLASACAMTTWFCDAYASWQKGAVENANGRLRRDLPRDLDLDALGDAELQEIVLTHNLTPRKCLGFLTPLQALLKELGKDVQIRFAYPVALRSGIHPLSSTDTYRPGARWIVSAGSRLLGRPGTRRFDVQGRTAGPAAAQASRADGRRGRCAPPLGLSGLGQHQGRLSLPLERGGQRGRDPRRPFPLDAQSRHGRRRADPGPAGHDRVLLPACATRADRRAHDSPEPAGNQWPAQDAHRLWPADARQPGRDDRGAAAGAGGDQVLDAGQVQGNERAQAPGQPDPCADRGEGEHPLAGEHAPSHRTPR